MENKGFARNVMLITCSNLIRFLANVVMTLLVPAILGTENYGFYKTFTLYLTYFGIFNLGFIDGIYLKFGGVDYESLDKSKFRMYTRFLFILELIVTILIFIFAVSALDGGEAIVFVFLALNMIAVQFTTYFQQISQITSRFSKQAIYDIIYSVVTLIIVGIIFFTGSSSYALFLSLIVGGNYLLLIWYIANYISLIKGENVKIKNSFSEIIKLMQIGIPLMISNLASQFILNMDRQIVSIFYSESEYGIYAFAYQILNVINIFISAISLVLYPLLKKQGEENLKKSYSDSNSFILILVYVCLTGVFPLVLIIQNLSFLSDYMASIPIVKIVFPVVAFTACISVIKHNYYKSLDKNNVYFIKSLVMLVISIVSNLVAYFCFKSMKAISVASIISMIIWYLDTELYMVKKYKVKFVKNLIYLLLMLGVYYLCMYLIPNLWIGMCIYGLIVLIVSFVLYKELIINLIKTFFRRKKVDGGEKDEDIN